jgi:hypothetical protein
LQDQVLFVAQAAQDALQLAGGQEAAIGQDVIDATGHGAYEPAGGGQLPSQERVLAQHGTAPAGPQAGAINHAKPRSLLVIKGEK